MYTSCSETSATLIPIATSSIPKYLNACYRLHKSSPPWFLPSAKWIKCMLLYSISQTTILYYSSTYAESTNDLFRFFQSNSRMPATFLAKLILLTLITLTILVKSTNYEAPHYVVFSILLSLRLPHVQISSPSQLSIFRSHIKQINVQLSTSSSSDFEHIPRPHKTSIILSPCYCFRAMTLTKTCRCEMNVITVCTQITKTEWTTK